MTEYQPSFRKIELNKNGLSSATTNNNNLFSKMNASSVQILNTSATELHSNQIMNSNSNNLFGVYPSNKYEMNTGNSFMQDPSVKGDFFENQIPIKIRQSGKEDTQTMLNLKIFTSSKGSGQSQVLRLELTDEQNHLFLFLMELSESEYLHVKKEQNLHVDFFSFPQQFAERVELCLRDDGENRVQKYSQNLSVKDEVSKIFEKENKIYCIIVSLIILEQDNLMNELVYLNNRFFCQLDIKNNSEADFNIVEMNQFKSSVHLSLKLRQANDEILKNFIAKKLQIQKNENIQLKIQNSALEEDLNQKCLEMRINDEELKKLQDEKRRTIEEMRLDEQSKFQKAKEEYLSREEKIRRQYEFNKSETDQKYREDIESYQDKYEKSLTKCQNLSEKLIQIEALLKEFQSKTSSYERESVLNKKEIEELRIQNRELNEIRFKQEKKITEFSFLNQGMVKQIEDKESLLVNNKDLVDNFNSQKEMLKQQCDEYRSQIQKLEQKLDLCSEEINKGNKIIEKLQDELSKQKNKIKTRNEMVKKQEKFLEDLKCKYDELNNELLKREREMNNKDLKIKEQESQINDYKEKIQESQKIIENNQSMIQYLNKQMNEGGNKSSMILTTAKPLTSTYQYSSIENKYSSANYTSTTGIARKYSYLDLNQENAQPLNNNNNINTATTPYSQTKESYSYGQNPLYSNNSNNYNTVTNKASYTPLSSNLNLQNNEILSVNQQDPPSPINKVDMGFTKQINYNNYNTGSSAAIHNNNNINNNTSNVSKQFSNQNGNNYSDLVSYTPNNTTSNNVTQSFTQSGQSQALYKYDRMQKEAENIDDQDFNSKYLFNNNNNNNNNKNNNLQKHNNIDDEAAEEPSRVTPIKYRQPKHPN